MDFQYLKKILFALIILFLFFCMSILTGCEENKRYQLTVTCTITEDFYFDNRKEAENFQKNTLSNDFMKNKINQKYHDVNDIEITHSYIFDESEDK